MKRFILGFILGLFLTFSIIVGAQTPSNNLNYVKLLKVPPVGQAKDSVLVFDSSDNYVKMRPQSTLSAAKAASVKSGTVKTDITQPDPIVYAKTTTDALLGSKANLSGTQTFTGIHNFPTATAGTNTTQVATTAFVTNGLVGKFNTPTGLTTNYLPKWNGSGFGNSQIFDNGTNVNIGNPGISNQK